jgi:hemerythrin
MNINPNDYITGITLIDKQHLHYIELVKRLISYCKSEEVINKPVFIDYVNELVIYMLEHFDAEEYLMRSTKYFLYTKHLAEHNMFRNKMDEFLAAVNDIDQLNITDYEDYLVKWLIAWFEIHVKDGDTKLAKFLQSQQK